jgi:hypothetical protein
MVLCSLSMVPFPLGLQDEEYICCIPRILHVSLKNAEVNDLPWSVTRIEPEPCLATICVAYARAHVSADMSSTGIASAYFVKWSIKVRRYLFFSTGQRIWSTNIHGGNFKRIGWLSNIS